MKKLASLLLALVMIMSCFSAMAENVATVSNATTTHTYHAYQIFAGTQATSEGALGDIAWGTGIVSATLLSELKASCDYFDTCETAVDVAKILEGKSDDCAEAKALANAAAKSLSTTYTEIAAGATSVKLPTGYWLLVDVTDVTGEHDARNSALLQVTSDMEITAKYSVPSVDKSIEGAGEATDSAIGDTLTFVLTGTLPSNLSDYDSYKAIFHDTMSEGLDFVEIVSVTVGDNTLASPTDYTATNVADTVTVDGVEKNVTKITVTINDVLAHEGVTSKSTIVVKYTAKVNSKAVIGSAGNPNEVYLEYSNDPNWDGEPEKEPTGNTPEDEVIVFVYELDVTKTDSSETPVSLAGAEFVLLNTEKTKIATFENGKFAGWIDFDNENPEYPTNSILTSGADGKFAVVGIDAGTYNLRETKAPAGYNILTEDIVVVIEATITGNETTQTLDKLTISVNGGDAVEGNVTTGVVNMDVKNNAGSTLPETGGMGTTILYVGGGILVLAAIVLLIAKRRTAA